MMTGYDENMIITATKFKAKCLELLDRVGKTGETLQITKRGKVVAELRAPQQKTYDPGFAKGEFRIVGDIMAPSDVEWEAMRDDATLDPANDDH